MNHGMYPQQDQTGSRSGAMKNIKLGFHEKNAWIREELPTFS
jgi:hypothetical protein